jgi:hypothetical protein
LGGCLQINVGGDASKKKQAGANDFSARWKKGRAMWDTMQALPYKMVKPQETGFGSMDRD